MVVTVVYGAQELTKLSGLFPSLRSLVENMHLKYMQIHSSPCHTSRIYDSTALHTKG